LDVSINGPLKKNCINGILAFKIDLQNTRKTKDEEILDSIISIWNIDKDFTREKMQKSFKITVI